MYTRLQVGDPKEDKASVQFLAERAELLLRVANSHGLRSRQQALEWLGSHFRVALMAPQHMSDMQASSATALWDLRDVPLHCCGKHVNERCFDGCLQAGELLLREHVFIHLEQPVDKLNTLVQVPLWVQF